jgi:uncharacterized glyoxalase superfamily protein PhnB
MIAQTVSTAFTTDKVEETKNFYIKYFGATVTFDCGWYVNLEFGRESSTLQFMEPQQPEHRLCNGTGLIYNFKVNDVDSEHERIAAAGLEVLMPLENHPWGDRGFAVTDPNGISIYIYSEREFSEEFKPYCK